MHPIREVTQALRKASNGNYDVFLRMPGKDELGELVNEFHNLVSHIRYKENSRPQLSISSQTKEPPRDQPYTIF